VAGADPNTELTIEIKIKIGLSWDFKTPPPILAAIANASSRDR
jgi:hypothetical protein